MKLEKGFQGKIIANTRRVFSPYNYEEVKKELKQSSSRVLYVTVSDSTSIGGWEYIYFSDNKSLNIRTVYNKHNEMYESMGDENYSIFIDVIKIYGTYK
jgi:hypothetical protein